MQQVLVVDDSSTIRGLIASALGNAGYGVRLAADGDEALALLDRLEPLPDLITLDIDMPQMSGFEVCERLRQRKGASGERDQRLGNIPVLFISAYDSLENRKAGYDLEVLDFISKPFNADDIVVAVNKVLRPAESFAGMRALVVDDSEVVRKLVASTLARSGVTVVGVADGLEAVSLIKQSEELFDIVITDYKMPQLRGDQLCRRLKTIPEMDQIPVFFISSSDKREAALEFFKAGASDYLKKPFLVEELQARVLNHLRVRKYVKELKEINEKLQVQAARDELTGLYNRRFFQETLLGFYARAKRYDREMSCLLLDLDFFKNINDTYGHVCGDRVLAEFAEMIRGRIRQADCAARYGGEEFIVIVPDTDCAGARILAESIRASAAEKFYRYGDERFQVTCSIGVSSFQDHQPATADKLVSMADNALYLAKERGRNRVEVYRREAYTASSLTVRPPGSEANT